MFIFVEWNLQVSLSSPSNQTVVSLNDFWGEQVCPPRWGRILCLLTCCVIGFCHFEFSWFVSSGNSFRASAFFLCSPFKLWLLCSARQGNGIQGLVSEFGISLMYADTSFTVLLLLVLLLQFRFRPQSLKLTLLLFTTRSCSAFLSLLLSTRRLSDGWAVLTLFSVLFCCRKWQTSVLLATAEPPGKGWPVRGANLNSEHLLRNL